MNPRIERAEALGVAMPLAGSFTSAGVYASASWRMIGSGARAPSAAAFAMRTIASSTSLRARSFMVRTVSWSFTSSGMMLCLVPPWMEPTVTTAGSSGGFSRLTSVCSERMVRAASTMGSTVVCG